MVKRGWNVSIAYFKDNVRENLPFIDQNVEAIKIDGIDCDEFHCSTSDASNVATRLTDIVNEKSIDVVIDPMVACRIHKGFKAEYSIGKSDKMLSHCFVYFNQ